jgi:hypothetical protein
MYSSVTIETLGHTTHLHNRKVVAFAMSGEIEIALLTDVNNAAGRILLASTNDEGAEIVLCEEYYTNEIDGMKAFAQYIADEYAGA